MSWLSQVFSVIRKYNKAIAGVAESTESLEGISSQRTAEEILRWTEQVEDAESRRSTDIDAMDIYETKEQQGNCFLCFRESFPYTLNDE